MSFIIGWNHILDRYGTVIWWNTRDKPNRRYKKINFTPVDDDPFLPWIHDMIPSNDERHLQFVSKTNEDKILAAPYKTLCGPCNLKLPCFNMFSSNEYVKTTSRWWHQICGSPSILLLLILNRSISWCQWKMQTRMAKKPDSFVDSTSLRWFPDTLGQPIFAEETLSVYSFNDELVS